MHIGTDLACCEAALFPVLFLAGVFCVTLRKIKFPFSQMNCGLPALSDPLPPPRQLSPLFGGVGNMAHSQAYFTPLGLKTYWDPTKPSKTVVQVK